MHLFRSHLRKEVDALSSAYFHCIGGASGDMILGSIVDAGIPLGSLVEALDKLNVSGYELSHQRAQRGGVNGSHVVVTMDDEGKRKRTWQSFVETTRASSLSAEVIERSCAVFQRLAEAEASVHGTTPDQIHLHELGEIDTLVDVVGSVAGLEMLGIDRLYASAFPAGSGVIHSEHGVLPVPSPATVALFAMARAPVVPAPGGGAETGEMVTPTGAAILTTLATFRQPSLIVEKIGYGLGTRESRLYPNALALWLGEETGAVYTSNHTIIETNIDDMTGEALGFVQEKLFAMGASDVWFTPIQMKKNRPATMLSAIVPTDLESQAVAAIIRETSTLGVRIRPLQRYESERDHVTVTTSLGDVKVKVKKVSGVVASVSVEYDDCHQIASDNDIPFLEVHRRVQREVEDNLLEN